MLYGFAADKPCKVTALCRGEGTLSMQENGQERRFPLVSGWQTVGITVPPAEGKLTVSLTCEAGEVTLEEIAAEPAPEAAL